MMSEAAFKDHRSFSVAFITVSIAYTLPDLTCSALCWLTREHPGDTSICYANSSRGATNVSRCFSRESTCKMSPFTVVGVYQDTDQRFSDTVHSQGPRDAEQLVRAAHPTLLIAAVFEGAIAPVDISERE